MAYKRTSPQPVAEGGTGQVTLTNHGVLVGAGTSAITQLAVGATNSLLQGTTGTDPAFTATPTVTSITFGSGSALSSYADWTSYTPTLDGAVSGSTTYTSQVGYWQQIGNMVTVEFTIVITAATGTGNMQISLPSTAKNVANLEYTGLVRFSSVGTIWPVGTTYPSVLVNPGAAFALIAVSGSAIATANMQMANTAMTVAGTVIYQV